MPIVQAAEISDMGVVPDGGSTAVHPNPARLEGFEDAFAATRRVVELNGHLLAVDGLV